MAPWLGFKVKHVPTYTVNEAIWYFFNTVIFILNVTD